jgi:hypothetical protein
MAMPSAPPDLSLTGCFYFIWMLQQKQLSIVIFFDLCTGI